MLVCKPGPLGPGRASIKKMALGPGTSFPFFLGGLLANLSWEALGQGREEWVGPLAPPPKPFNLHFAFPESKLFPPLLGAPARG